jgi:hypothetical protein
MLRETKGHGDRAMLAALRAAGERDPRRPLTYDRFGRFDAFFDGSSGGAGAALDAEPVAGRWEGYGPDGRPRRSGLLPPPRE